MNNIYLIKFTVNYIILYHIISYMIVKPFLKWIGGKTQIIETLLNNYPKKINNYYDIFLGGGSTLFGLLSYVKDDKIKITGKIYAYDINKDLINLYKNIQKYPKKIYKKYSNIVNEYTNIKINIKINRNPKTKEEGLSGKESYYYWIRNKYNEYNENKKNITKSAMFLFLNKTCFRGMYRIGPNGFNVPYGHYKNLNFIDKKTLINISEFIKNVKFRCKSFDHSIIKLKIGDFAYLDPPYAPEKKTSFVKYNVDGFNIDQHKKLFEMCKKLKDKKIKFIMSNSNVKLVKKAFPKKIYSITIIECRRAINSKNPGKTTNEIIIKDY